MFLSKCIVGGVKACGAKQKAGPVIPRNTGSGRSVSIVNRSFHCEKLLDGSIDGMKFVSIVKRTSISLYFHKNVIVMVLLGMISGCNGGQKEDSHSRPSSIFTYNEINTEWMGYGLVECLSDFSEAERGLKSSLPYCTIGTDSIFTPVSFLLQAVSREQNCSRISRASILLKFEYYLGNKARRAEQK